MTTKGLYEIEISEGDDGTTHPTEQLWTPGKDAMENGFIVHRGVYVTGIDDPTDDHLYPIGFVALGHQRWADIIEAAAAYMARIHGWRNLHLYPGDDPSVTSPASRAPSSLTASSYGTRTLVCARSVTAISGGTDENADLLKRGSLGARVRR
ncbi:hypothetical protein [Streptomyces galbus]|uniref:hypothetical protein n=1 Tax=Streptomyces galbus TaxID=33898 RepID=UPI0019A2D32E|nr:hypothetical protein [Streptomyces galbus]GHD52185.1 hypothetical protein GCM10010335_64300 [Streptomyces galbus]